MMRSLCRSKSSLGTISIESLQGLRDLQHDSERSSGRKRPLPPDIALQIFAFDKFHGVEVGVSLFPELVNGSDVRMMDQGSRLGLAQEPSPRLRTAQQFGGNHLQGYRTVQHAIYRFVGDAHSAFAKAKKRAIVVSQDLEMRESFGGCVRLLLGLLFRNAALEQLARVLDQRLQVWHRPHRRSPYSCARSRWETRACGLVF